MLRPLIGLTGQRFRGEAIAGNLEVLHDSPIDVFYADYARAVVHAGGLPVFVPLDVDPESIIGRFDGLLLTGGCDIDPGRYRAVRDRATEASDPLRDEAEVALFNHAVARSVPTLGVCRGLQLVNVAAGGTLRQHVPSHAHLDEPGDVEQHDIAIEPGSTLAMLYGSTKPVNSLHHQTVDQVGSELRVTAESADGVVEGLEHIAAPVVAVQWHPEMLATAACDPIFAWLVNAAGARWRGRSHEDRLTPL